jgi:hypothetical protein
MTHRTRLFCNASAVQEAVATKEQKPRASHSSKQTFVDNCHGSNKIKKFRTLYEELRNQLSARK